MFLLSHIPPPKKRTFGKVAFSQVSLCSRWVVGMLESISQFLILSIDCASCYRPQMNFAKVMFFTPVSQSFCSRCWGGGRRLVCIQGVGQIPPSDTGYGQQVGGMHPVQYFLSTQKTKFQLLSRGTHSLYNDSICERR